VNLWLIAALWIALALLAVVVSVRLAISVALVEIFIGILAGNLLHLQTDPWVDFLAGFGSIVLTFLAGAEIDPSVLRVNWRESVVIGFFSFLMPALGAFAAAYWIFSWSLQAAQIAGIALSTTSVAIVYAVMVESGLNESSMGKIILAACFVTDLGTVLALGLFFARYDRWLVVFVAVTIGVLCLVPRVLGWFFAWIGQRVSEPEIKIVFLLLLGLGGLASQARSEAVLPAYLLGLVLARQFLSNRVLMHRMRAIAFALLTPFYFLKAGLLVSLPAVLGSLLGIAAFFLVKMLAKGVGVYPFTRWFRFGRREGTYTTLLMATGLTFGSISALFGLTNGYINQQQYTLLVTVVILSAVVPTLIAERYFRPTVSPVEIGAERTTTLPALEPLRRED
jgi:Kef-type K+ transport system membrane component KefB